MQLVNAVIQVLSLCQDDCDIKFDGFDGFVYNECQDYIDSIRNESNSDDRSLICARAMDFVNEARSGF